LPVSSIPRNSWSGKLVEVPSILFPLLMGAELTGRCSQW
jgi:hypothetical protein